MLTLKKTLIDEERYIAYVYRVQNLEKINSSTYGGLIKMTLVYYFISKQ